MTDLIKERIDQIRSGKVPSGYVKTRAGIMPVDWKHDVQAKHVFQSYTNKDHHGNYEILAATQENGIVPRNQLDKEIKCSDEGIDGYKIVSRGDFIISLRSFQGGIEYSEYDGLVSPAYTVLKPIHEISDGYYKYYFKSNDFISRLNGAVYGIRDGKQIGYEDFGDLYIHFPSLAEQRRITDILTYCDKIIALYQQQMDELKKEKSYFQKNMFLQQGETNPRIRFPGFTSPWEHRKLGEMSESYSGGTPTAGIKEYYNGEIPFIRSAEINNDTTELFLSEEGLQNSSARLVSVGDILYALYGATSGEVGRARLKGAINQAILAIKPYAEHDTEFLAQWLRKSKHNIIGTYLQGGQGNLSGTIVKELLVEFPSLQEQQQIGNFFASLDNLITLHQRKLDEARRERKALMQLLLTGIVRVKT